MITIGKKVPGKMVSDMSVAERNKEGLKLHIMIFIVLGVSMLAFFIYQYVAQTMGWL